MVISAMFQSENKTVAETNQQQQQQQEQQENKIVEQEDTLPSLQERKQLWQALEQKQKQQQQQEQGEKIKFTNNHNKILIGNKKQQLQQQQQQQITTNQTGVSGGEYYVAVGKLPKSPSFHSGLDLLADDKCDEQASNGGHDYANTDDSSRHFVFNSTTTTTTNGRENILHENLLNTLQQQQQQEQKLNTMSTPTTITTTTSITNVNNSTGTLMSTAVPTTVATITISSTLVSTLAQQFSTNIKTAPNNLAVGATPPTPPQPSATTTTTTAAVATTTATNGESNTATTSLFTASYKSPVSAATAIKNILNSTKGVGNAVANNASNILGFNGSCNNNNNNNNNISTNLKHESNNKHKLSATASMLINETVQQLTKNSTLESQKARFDENSSGSSTNTMPTIKNGPNSLTSSLPHTLQQLSGSPGRARDRNVFHAPTTPTNVAALPLLRGLFSSSTTYTLSI